MITTKLYSKTHAFRFGHDPHSPSSVTMLTLQHAATGHYTTANICAPRNNPCIQRHRRKARALNGRKPQVIIHGRGQHLPSSHRRFVGTWDARHVQERPCCQQSSRTAPPRPRRGLASKPFSLQQIIERYCGRTDREMKQPDNPCNATHLGSVEQE